VSALNDPLARFFLRYTSLLVGLRRIPVVGSCLRWASTKILPRDSLTWVQVQHGNAAGLWLRLNPRTGRSILEGGRELEVQRSLYEHLRPGMNFYDIGANIGFFSLIAAHLVGEHGHVTAFEADPENAARLREHIARNKLSQVVVEEKAVWSELERRTVMFARTDPTVSPDRGTGHVASAAEPDTIQVAAVSLDEYTSTSPAPDFLKCDVEGAELEVFRGARRLLREKRPGIICEMHSEENRRTLIDEFTKIGYACKPCGENHVLALPK
jgi:FkbM family methyltransferase